MYCIVDRDRNMFITKPGLFETQGLAYTSSHKSAIQFNTPAEADKAAQRLSAIYPKTAGDLQGCIGELQEYVFTYIDEERQKARKTGAPITEITWMVQAYEAYAGGAR